MIYFNYLLLYYLTVLFEQVYPIGLSSVVSEMLAYTVAGSFYERLGIHGTYMVVLGMSLAGGILVITYGLDHQGGFWFPVIFLFTRFGAAASFLIVVLGNSTLFEVKKAATALSVPMFMARAAMGVSPLISTLE